MTSLIAWLDASSEDQRRMREIVSLFSERESRDELGIGQTRDAISDLLWPGTSTLFTRARYFLFIPWCFRAAAVNYNDVAKVTAVEDRHERRLISALLAAGETDGVIGGNVKAALKTLPSSLYWGGMRTHGILNDQNLSREDTIVAEVDRAHSRHPVAAEYEDDDTPWRAGAFHSTLPPVPSGFPDEVPAGFKMSRSEAGWLRDRMLGSSPGTLLEYALRHRPEPNSATPWEDSVMRAADGERAEVLDDARRFSILMNGASLLYNLLLAEAYERERFSRIDNPTDRYRSRLTEWSERPGLNRDIATWDQRQFWARVKRQNPNVNPRSRRFIDGWLDLLSAIDPTELAENEAARAFIAKREEEHKRGQARLKNNRLLQAWLGSAGSNPLVYRWPQVRPVLQDIHDGLERTDA